VSVDSDDKDVVRVVRSAAEQDLICGEFFVSQPDFEFFNFTLDELEDAVWEMTTKDDASLNASQGRSTDLRRAVRGCRSGKQLEQAAQAALPAGSEPISKGERWGRNLMECAMRRPRLPDGRDRPVTEAARKAVTAGRSSYRTTRDQRRVDPQTGLLVDR
jgi:hypothetical protein